MTTILVVDDNPEGRKIAGACLKEHGVAAVYAENGLEALKVIQKNRPDAVLTDLHMPEMDGLSLVERMRIDHPSVPVVLMTDHGTGQTAVAALRAGAASFVPKKDMKTDLCDAMGVVMATLEAKNYRERVRGFLQQSKSHFVMGYEPEGPTALVSHFQADLARLNFCDETRLFQVSTALTEALSNAIDHGNLELDSTLREKSEQEYAKQREERMQQTPYRDRRVHVTVKLTPPEVTYVIRDEGPGFDWSKLPDPTDPENLLKASGRGVMLIRTFMDDVTFNDSGSEITMTKRCVDGC